MRAVARGLGKRPGGTQPAVIVDELGRATRPIATGGLAPLIASGSRYTVGVDELLSLAGLRLLYECNQDPRRQEYARGTSSLLHAR